MNENGMQKIKTLEEQLEELKLEQAEAERIYRGRMEMGVLANDPASVQELAQTILERKLKIDDLEAQIAKDPKEAEEKQTLIEDKDNNETNAMTVYNGKNPVLRWLQKILNKLQDKSQKLSERSKMSALDKNKAMFEKEMDNVKEMKYNEYAVIANMKTTEMQAPKNKSAHQRFVDQISGNGTYHTFGPNAKNMESSMTQSAENRDQVMNNDRGDR